MHCTGAYASGCRARFARVKAAGARLWITQVYRADSFKKTACGDVYEMSKPGDRALLQRGLVLHALPKMLAIVPSLASPGELSEWLDRNVFCASDRSAFEAIEEVYAEIGDLCARMTIGNPTTVDGRLAFGKGDPGLCAAREVQGRFACNFWARNGAAARCMAEERLDAARQKRANWLSKAPRLRCIVEVRDEMWQSGVRKCDLCPAVLVEWDVRAAAAPIGDSLSLTADAMRSSSLVATDRRAPLSGPDRCAVAGLGLGALVTREVCYTWGGHLREHADNWYFYHVDKPVLFDAVRFEPPAFDEEKPERWRVCTGRVVRKFFDVAVHRGARYIVLPKFGCDNPQNGPLRGLAAIYAENIQRTLGAFDYVGIWLGKAANSRGFSYFSATVMPALQDALGCDNSRIVWAGRTGPFKFATADRCSDDGSETGCADEQCTCVHLCDKQVKTVQYSSTHIEHLHCEP